MRWTRAGTAVGILGLVLLCAGWWLSATGASEPTPARAPTLSTSGLNPSLQHVLQEYLARAWSPARPEARVPPLLALAPALPPGDRQIRPQGTTCPVAAGAFCSLTPCVQFAGSGSGAVLRSAVIAARVGGPAVLMLGQTATATRHPQQPAGHTCQGRAGPGQGLRISGA